VPLRGKFTEVRQLLSQHGVDQVDAILFDLGSSSMQYDDPDRGFSISKGGPLDMRMDGNLYVLDLYYLLVTIALI